MTQKQIDRQLQTRIAKSIHLVRDVAAERRLSRKERQFLWNTLRDASLMGTRAWALGRYITERGRLEARTLEMVAYVDALAEGRPEPKQKERRK